MNARGDTGELRVGYQRAALLGSWQLKLLKKLPSDRFKLEANVRSANNFWCTQGPFELRLRVGSSYWVWRDVVADIAHTGVKATVLGKPHIEKDGAHELHGRPG